MSLRANFAFVFMIAWFGQSFITASAATTDATTSMNAPFIKAPFTKALSINAPSTKADSTEIGSTASDLQTLTVGMPEPGQVPFFWKNKQDEYTGIYADTLRLIAQDLKLSLSFIPLSQARLQRFFIAGDVDIEAGVTRETETDPVLKSLSLYTRPFGVVNQVFIYRQDQTFPVFIIKDLEGQRVATVRGSVVPDKILREDFANQWQIAQRVHRGWNELGLMKEAVALHYQRQDNLNYQISLPYDSKPIVFRLHTNKAGLLEDINASIQRLEKEGELERIVCKYLCGSSTAK